METGRHQEVELDELVASIVLLDLDVVLRVVHVLIQRAQLVLRARYLQGPALSKWVHIGVFVTTRTQCCQRVQERHRGVSCMTWYTATDLHEVGFQQLLHQVHGGIAQVFSGHCGRCLRAASPTWSRGNRE